MCRMTGNVKHLGQMFLVFEAVSWRGGLAGPCGMGGRAVSAGNRRRSADLGRYRRGPAAQTSRTGRKQPLAGHVARLEKLGIEYQLQLAQLVFLGLSPPKFQELSIRDEFQLARFCRTWRGSKRGRSRGGERAERAFPETAVP